MKLTLSFYSSRFSYMTKKSWQTLKYLENKKSFEDQMKDIFHHFWRAFSQANNTFFFGRSESDFKLEIPENLESFAMFLLFQMNFDLIISDLMPEIRWTFDRYWFLLAMKKKEGNLSFSVKVLSGYFSPTSKNIWHLSRSFCTAFNTMHEHISCH